MHKVGILLCFGVLLAFASTAFALPLSFCKEQSVNSAIDRALSRAKELDGQKTEPVDDGAGGGFELLVRRFVRGAMGHHLRHAGRSRDTAAAASKLRDESIRHPDPGSGLRNALTQGTNVGGPNSSVSAIGQRKMDNYDTLIKNMEDAGSLPRIEFVPVRRILVVGLCIVGVAGMGQAGLDGLRDPDRFGGRATRGWKPFTWLASGVVSDPGDLAARICGDSGHRAVQHRSGHAERSGLDPCGEQP